MGEHIKEQSYEIRQRWKVSRFLPPPDRQNDEQEDQFDKFWIDECLGCEDRDWNVPEMLVEFRMVAEASGVIASEYNLSYPIHPMEHPYGTIQAGLFLVFQFLRNCALDYKHSRIILEQVHGDKREFLDFWGQNKTIIHSAKPKHKGPIPGALHDVLEEFAELLVRDSLLRQNCWPELHNGLEEYFAEADTYEGRCLKGERLEQLGALLYRFCHSYLSKSKERTAGKNIHTIEKILRGLPVYSQISNEIDLPRCNKWNHAYLDAVGELLQKTADAVGRELSRDEKHEGTVLCLVSYAPHSVENMLRNVKNAMKAVNISEEDIVSYIQETRKKHHRKCVAMLEAQNLPNKIVAFSGYADNNDPDVECYLSSGLLYDDLLALCEAYQFTLANLSPEVVSKIVRFDKNRLKGPMRKELFDILIASKCSSDAELKKMVRGEIRNKYSCCERKILAKIEADHLSPKNGLLRIKFSPCPSCRKTLGHYERQYGRNWEINYLHKY